MSGEIDATPSSMIWLNSRRRYVNRDEFLGIGVNHDQTTNNTSDANHGNQRVHESQIQQHQRRHRTIANHFQQLNRQNLIQEHIDRRNRRFGHRGRNKAAEWYNVMRFIQNMDTRAEEDVGQTFRRRVGRMMQSGDGYHINLYRNHQNQSRNNDF